MTKWLRVRIALTEDQSVVRRTHVRWLTNACMLSSRRSDAQLCPLQTLYSHAQTYHT